MADADVSVDASVKATATKPSSRIGMIVIVIIIIVIIVLIIWAMIAQSKKWCSTCKKTIDLCRCIKKKCKDECDDDDDNDCVIDECDKAKKCCPTTSTTTKGGPKVYSYRKSTVGPTTGPDTTVVVPYDILQSELNIVYSKTTSAWTIVYAGKYNMSATAEMTPTGGDTFTATMAIRVTGVEYGQQSIFDWATTTAGLNLNVGDVVEIIFSHNDDGTRTITGNNVSIVSLF